MHGINITTYKSLIKTNSEYNFGWKLVESDMNTNLDTMIQRTSQFNTNLDAIRQ
jgi:hypothetical protein